MFQNWFSFFRRGETDPQAEVSGDSFAVGDLVQHKFRPWYGRIVAFEPAPTAGSREKWAVVETGEMRGADHLMFFESFRTSVANLLKMNEGDEKSQAVS
ncbi:TPA: hypothetical protein DCL30_04415 [Candidatus Peribacteria bacterium]|nr:MAG: hypothetical protein A3J91_02215 [Candidatus Peribacteria bacterium RIFOXYC2_FULL_58_10]OGJ84022.1 MAG: hypothetical protein A2529_04470 [Candidatus Peribacteria bacterium RIFOXYD2_FULL_58_15]HAI98750.1 hypothetical protein [Candidatus Peribacteria bacterium]HAS34130.1 hypothetical protein [Candidatus Peribacteria bacterium]